MADILDDVGDSIAKPKKVTTGAGSIEQHPLSEQVAAAKAILAKNAGSKNRLGIRFRKIIPPGMVTGQSIETNCD
jgi:hypothetical protein